MGFVVKARIYLSVCLCPKVHCSGFIFGIHDDARMQSTLKRPAVGLFMILFKEMGFVVKARIYLSVCLYPKVHCSRFIFGIHEDARMQSTLKRPAVFIILSKEMGFVVKAFPRQINTRRLMLFTGLSKVCVYICHCHCEFKPTSFFFFFFFSFFSSFASSIV